jgi:hypothetical protein
MINEIGTGGQNWYEYIKTTDSNSRKVYSFITDDGDRYIVNFLCYQKNDEYAWEIEYGNLMGVMANFTTVMNKGRLYRIMTTLIKIINEFVQEESPNIMTISPSQTKGEEDRRRYKLYLYYILKNLSSEYDIIQGLKTITIVKNEIE